ncbi:MAG: SH3 domain-containing protein [Selenomonadaceae bacterium]|nr:SH3 domain-containing protein [Selenomonadaceae bacterium]
MSESIYTDERATLKYWMDKLYVDENTIWEEIDAFGVNKRIRKKTKTLRDLSKFPNKLRFDEAQEMILEAEQFFRDGKPACEYYDSDGSPISESDFKAAKENCNIENLKKNIIVRYALTIRRDNLRLLPTEKNFFDDKNFLHYDDLQGTALDPLEPVAVLHESVDGKFCFAVSAYYTGWIVEDALIFTDRAEWIRCVRPKDYIVALSDKAILTYDNKVLQFQGGKILPIIPFGFLDQIYMPQKIEEKLSKITEDIEENDDFDYEPLSFIPWTVVLTAFDYIDYSYGWGGMEGGVDCSSFVMNVYRVMGINLPRDADEQEKAMPESVKLTNLTEEQRFEEIKNAPVGALLFSRNHVMLYLGTDDNGEPSVIHALSSYYDFQNGVGEKHYVRKVVVSDLHFKNSQNVEMINSLTSIGYFKRWR